MALPQARRASIRRLPHAGRRRRSCSVLGALVLRVVCRRLAVRRAAAGRGRRCWPSSGRGSLGRARLRPRAGRAASIAAVVARAWPRRSPGRCGLLLALGLRRGGRWSPALVPRAPVSRRRLRRALHRPAGRWPALAARRTRAGPATSCCCCWSPGRPTSAPISAGAAIGGPKLAPRDRPTRPGPGLGGGDRRRRWSVARRRWPSADAAAASRRRCCSRRCSAVVGPGRRPVRNRGSSGASASRTPATSSPATAACWTGSTACCSPRLRCAACVLLAGAAMTAWRPIDASAHVDASSARPARSAAPRSA